jgi:hypothetical protein
MEGAGGATAGRKNHSPADAAATYCQVVEPPVHRERPADGVLAGPGESPGPSGDADVIEMGGHPPRWPWGTARGPAIGMVLAALAAGLLLGFAGGRLQAGADGRPARAATSAATVFAVGDPLIDTGDRCAVQLGHALQLGVEVVNESDRAVALRQIEPVLPLGGLKAVASRWGTCGALPELGPGPGQATALGPGATGWLTVTFDVMVSCPQPLPVQFKISYAQAGRLVTAEFAGFPDLGQVQYNNCGTNPAG